MNAPIHVGAHHGQQHRQQCDYEPSSDFHGSPECIDLNVSTMMVQPRPRVHQPRTIDPALLTHSIGVLKPAPTAGPARRARVGRENDAWRPRTDAGDTSVSK